jgi:multidrug transporter EmrE-like cation transporter
MQYTWLGVAIVSTVAYHIVLKLTPAEANPFLSLTVTYVVVALGFAAIYAVSPGTAPLRTELGLLNWTALGLGVAVAVLDFAFFMMYRVGFPISFGQLVTQTAAAVFLVLLGVAFFKDKLSLANVAGILLCVAGLWLINRR